MEVIAPSYQTPTEVPMESDVLRVHYPRQQYAVGALFFYLFLVGTGIGMLGLAYKSWEIGLYGPAVFVSVVAGLNIVMFVPKVVNHVAAWVRGVRGAWWLQLSTTGFAINDRFWGRPHRYRWCEIASFALVPKVGATDRVAFHYSRECHRFRPRRRTKPDGYVVGHWDLPADEALELMAEWLTRYRAS